VKHFIKLTDMDMSDLRAVFSMADNMQSAGMMLSDKSVVLFFPNTSLRTRVTFEKGIALLGGQPILFPYGHFG